jgi:hypothetical protein
LALNNNHSPTPSLTNKGGGRRDRERMVVATGWWFSPGPLVSSTNNTDRHDIAELLLKVALNTKKKQKKNTNKQANMFNQYILSGNTQ